MVQGPEPRDAEEGGQGGCWDTWGHREGNLYCYTSQLFPRREEAEWQGWEELWQAWLCS